jgi:Flp pilus assembly protein CpaB
VTSSSPLSVLMARHRRLLAAVLAAATVGFGLLALRPAPPPTVRVLVAAHDLPGGATLRSRDIRTAAFPAAAVPDGALGSDTPRSGAAGRVLTGPMRRGEPFTDARLLGAGLLDGYGPGVVATPVRLADADAARLLHPGDRVDVLAVAEPSVADPFEDSYEAPSDDPSKDPSKDPSEDAAPAAPATPAVSTTSGSRVRTIVSSVPVIAVPRQPFGSEGALVVLATSRQQASVLAGAGNRLSVTITAGPD